MKILISEEQFIRLKEAELEEEVGVPQYIISTAIKIYNKLITNLEKEKKSLSKLNKEKIELKGMFPIGDIMVRKIIFDFNLRVIPNLPEIDFISATQRSLSKLLDRMVFKTANKKTEISIGFALAIPTDTKVKDIINFLKTNKNDIIPTIAHEVQHSYFGKKSKYEPLKRRAGYQAIQQLNFGMIEPLNDFLFHLYFIHEIENIVRPTELATKMELEGVTRSQFLEFLKNTEAYKHLDNIRNFSYEKLRNDLMKFSEMIRSLLERINVNTQGMEDDKLIDEILRIFLINLTNSKGDVMKEILTTDPFEMLLGFSGDKEEFFRKYLRYITKFGEDFESYFKQEEKRLQRTADQVIRKMAKVFSLAKKES